MGEFSTALDRQWNPPRCSERKAREDREDGKRAHRCSEEALSNVEFLGSVALFGWCGMVQPFADDARPGVELIDRRDHEFVKIPAKVSPPGTEKREDYDDGGGDTGIDMNTVNEWSWEVF